MHAGIYASLAGRKRGRKWEKLAGYTLDDLIWHLERQFSKGMNWENYGSWHVDHIVPIASFDIQSAEDPAFRVCWALANLRPLWAAENLRKNAKMEFLI
jgi:hypothetical protein